MRICIKCKKREGSWWDHLCQYCRKIPVSKPEALAYEKLNESKDILSQDRIEYTVNLEKATSSYSSKFVNLSKELIEKLVGFLFLVLFMFLIYFVASWFKFDTNNNAENYEPCKTSGHQLWQDC
ncbi:MAG: hypothetical protein Q7K40_04335 [bacterium]|nr:hypothetical protein [bacterium]